MYSVVAGTAADSDVQAASPGVRGFVRQTHPMVIAGLVNDLLNDARFIALVGAPGSGKTTVAGILREEMERHGRRVRLVSRLDGANLAPRDIASQVLGDPKAAPDPIDPVRLSQLLAAQRPADHSVIIVDDAETLLPDAQDYLVALSRTGAANCPQLVLVGRPACLASSDVRPPSLLDVITAHWEMAPLNETQSGEFVARLVNADGLSAAVGFTDAGLAALARHGNGSFGRIVALLSIIRLRAIADAVRNASGPVSITEWSVEAAVSMLRPADMPRWDDAPPAAQDVTLPPRTTALASPAMIAQAYVGQGAGGNARLPWRRAERRLNLGSVIFRVFVFAAVAAAGGVVLGYLPDDDGPAAPLATAVTASGLSGVVPPGASPVGIGGTNPSRAAAVASAGTDGDDGLDSLASGDEPREPDWTPSAAEFAAAAGRLPGAGRPIDRPAPPSARTPPPDVPAAAAVAANAPSAAAASARPAAVVGPQPPPQARPSASVNADAGPGHPGATDVGAPGAFERRAEPAKSVVAAAPPHPAGGTQQAAVTDPSGPARASAVDGPHGPVAIAVATAAPAATPPTSAPVAPTPAGLQAANAGVAPPAPHQRTAVPDNRPATITQRDAMSAAAGDRTTAMAAVGAAGAPEPPRNPAAQTAAAPPPDRQSPAAASSAPTAFPGEVALLQGRADEMLRIGDVAAARMLYERAAELGSARAAVAAARTYDPAYLATIPATGLSADRAMAAEWYRRAVALGDSTAGQMATRVAGAGR